MAKTEEKKFEQLMEELETIVKELENGDADLDKSIEKYTEAMNIIKICNDKLNSAEEKVNKILKENGTLEEFNINDGE
ncbi:MAG: exodeoxyribonuclease VII small subunit [Bacilli bacterium]|nr:exodeoxyribonuclease VII small subunit [Bacilli bacterium]